MIKGKCNCETVVFELSCDASDVYFCHCSICRKSTGVNGIAVVVVKKSEFQWIKGKQNIQTWDKPGHDWQTSFCKTCGSTLPGPNDDSRMYVPAGLLVEGDKKLKVAHHIWVDSKANWDEIGDNGKRHPKAFKN